MEALQYLSRWVRIGLEWNVVNEKSVVAHNCDWHNWAHHKRTSTVEHIVYDRHRQWSITMSNLNHKYCQFDGSKKKWNKTEIRKKQLNALIFLYAETPIKIVIMMKHCRAEREATEPTQINKEK